MFNVYSSSQCSHRSMFTLFQFNLITCLTASKYCTGVFLPVIYIFISLPAPVCVCVGGGGAHKHVIYVPSVKNQYKRVVFGYNMVSVY